MTNENMNYVYDLMQLQTALINTKHASSDELTTKEDLERELDKIIVQVHKLIREVPAA